jgi:cobalt/nickel transport system ATP-binding protein
MEIMESLGDIIKVSDLHFAYPDEHVALRGVSFNLCEGDKVALVGPNGAGKSTLMLQLNGILDGRGGIEIGGMRLRGDNLPVINAMVGYHPGPDDQPSHRPCSRTLPLVAPWVAEDGAGVDSALEAVRMSSATVSPTHPAWAKEAHRHHDRVIHAPEDPDPG